MNAQPDTAATETTRSVLSDTNSETAQDFLTIYIADQVFGIPVLQVQDVLGEQTVTKVPLAPPEVAGSLNLRGRIVTAINVRKRLGLPASSEKDKKMSVVVEYNNELFSLIIDKVGDVLTLDNKNYEQSPATLDKLWRQISDGIFRMENNLLIVLDVSKLIDSVHD
jgi:purine-binding chemotaxis protein CheW